MRYALIDNSTLTGVQRLLGQIPIKNKLIIDMDIMCMESLIEAILFYDKILIIDDYKERFRSSRQKAFPHFMSIGDDILPLNDLLASTISISEGIVPRIEAGRFTDGDFKPFFEMLKMNVTFTWDMHSSEYYLTMKMLSGDNGLGLEKYSQLSSAIYSEVTDKFRSENSALNDVEPILIDRYGKHISSDYCITDKSGSEKSIGIMRRTQTFFDSLNWLAFRTIFYTLAANNLKVDLFLHPIRHNFQTNFLSKLNQSDNSVFRPLIDSMNKRANKTVNTILGELDPFVTNQEIPLFVNWFAQKVGNPDRYIEYAFQLRTEKAFVEARRRLIDLEMCLESNNFTREANSLIIEVNKSLDTVLSKYGASTSQGVSISSFITLWNLSTILKPLPKVPNIDLRIKELEFIKHIIPQKGFKSVYKSIVSDLSQIGRLGKYHEVISSKIILDKEAASYYEKEELSRYANAKSGIKVPM
jgi:hypothetical protein